MTRFSQFLGTANKADTSTRFRSVIESGRCSITNATSGSAGCAGGCSLDVFIFRRAPPQSTDTWDRTDQASEPLARQSRGRGGWTAQMRSRSHQPFTAKRQSVYCHFIALGAEIGTVVFAGPGCEKIPPDFALTLERVLIYLLRNVTLRYATRQR